MSATDDRGGMVAFGVNLAHECGPLPSGADLAGYNGYSGNLTLTVEGALSWNGDPMQWAVRIEKPTVTKSGRKGKPHKVLLLVGESVPELLRQIAHMWDLGTVETGKDYPSPSGRVQQS